MAWAFQHEAKDENFRFRPRMKGMTLADVEAHNSKVAGWRDWPNEHAEPTEAPVARPEYKPYRERRKGMNGLESAYASRLEAQRQAGEIEWWAFEPMKFKLADGAWYTPDFIILKDGAQFAVETKGFWREAARVRCKVFASKYPHIRLIAAKRVQKEWVYEQF